ncbi:MAG TPA: DUF4097 family beta strand repeat-containing protein [Terriglobales bacterium]
MASPAPYYYSRPPRRRSIFGPIVLIIIGVLFMMRNFGYRLTLLRSLAHWWPVLLIVWGAIRLWEYYDARRKGEIPPRFGFGAVLFVILLLCIGAGFSQYDKVRQDVDWTDLNLDDDVVNLFGSHYTYDGQLDQQFATGAALHIVNDRGNVTINAWDQPQVRVSYHKRVFAGGQQEADKANSATNPQFSTQGNVILLNSNTEGSGGRNVANDLEISMPRNAAVELTCRRGDVTVNGRQGDVKVTVSKGDVSVNDIVGNVNVSMHGGSLHADKVNGSITGDGRFQDTILSDVSGAVTMNGDFFGDIRLSKLAKGIAFHSSRTDMEIAKIDGDLSMSSGDLRAEKVNGPFNLRTKGKDVNLENFIGDVKIVDDTGDISLQAAEKLPMGNIDVNTTHGDVRIGIPPKASFRWNARTKHGSIEADREFGQIQTADNENSTGSGVVAGGTSNIQIVSESGDIQLHRGSALPVPPVPPTPPNLPAPKGELKGPKQLPAPAVPPKIENQ